MAPTAPASTMAACAGRKLSLLGVLGVAISVYALHVKQQKLAWQGGYAALCDSAYFSCSQVLTSEYGSLLSHLGLARESSILDISNASLGVLTFSLFALYPVLRPLAWLPQFYVLVSSGAMVVLAYLAYILAFVLRDFCVVCVATYAVTACLLWNSLALLRAERTRQSEPKAVESKKTT